MNLIRPSFSLLCLAIAFSVASFAQPKWAIPANHGMGVNASYRFEDVHFINSGTGFAVSLKSFLYKTYDSGRSWSIKNIHPNSPMYRSIEFLDDGKTGITGTLNAVGLVYRSTDSGETWTDISTSVPDTSTDGVKRMCGLAHHGNIFYGVGWYGGKVAKVYKSTDKGVSWQTNYIDTNLATGLVDAHFVSDDTGFVTGTRRAHNKIASVILKTTDGGSTWNEVFSDTTLGGYVWKIQFVTDQYVVGAIQNVYLPDSVAMVRSFDGGDSWDIVGVGNKSFLRSNSTGTQSCGFVTPAKGWVGGYYDGIFETTDSGKSWNYVPFGRFFNRIFVMDVTLAYAAGIEVYRYGMPGGTSVNSAVHSSVADRHHLHPIYPNPAKGKVNITFDLACATNVVLDVVNISGQGVYHVANTHLGKGKYTYEWDSANAPPGTYITLLMNNEAPYTQQFILSR